MLDTKQTEPTTYTVLKLDGAYYVMGLTDECPWRTAEEQARGRLLMYHYEYPEVETPECDYPTNTKMMFGALYDLVQCYDGITDGSTFVTPHGLFRVVGGYQLERVAETKNEAKARRARLRRLAKKTTRPSTLTA